MWNLELNFTGISISVALCLIPYFLLRRVQRLRVSIHYIQVQAEPISNVDTRQDDAAYTAEHHCLPAPKLRLRYPLGLDHILDTFAAARDKRVLRYFVGVVERSGVTFEQTLLGERGFGTVEPRNLEVLLSGKFTSM